MDLSTSQTGTQRALAAIVLTDAVSFSARMSVDEEGTLTLIQRDLKIIADLCVHYGGQVLKSTGDGLLMSFSSAVQAVTCSQEIQKELTARSEGMPPEDYLQHRIGIHLGDVLFSHSDVLGNGVNIAARLQTKATPGGICISQTVYDVVKARVNINATYLGPLQLKNIQEPVPAFQIPPFGQSATMVVQPTPVVGTPNAEPLAIAAQSLLQEVQYRRVKKLIFGAYQGVWENDPTVLAQFELLSLLEKLCQRYRTLAALECGLQAIASRLNRKSEYLAIADIIVKALEPIYQHQETVADSAEQTVMAGGEGHHQTVAAKLSQQQDQARIKKLLYAIIHSAWENDPDILAQQSMVQLVSTVHQMTPTEADLTYHLERIVKRLNRQSRYTQIALLISDAFQPLFGASPETSLMAHDGTALEPSGGETVMAGADNGDGAPTETRFDSDLTPFEEQTFTIENASESGAKGRTRDRANLFGLRLEIMRYTNPLRAKILLLSTVRSPFTFNEQDWITLKAKTLDDLVHDVFSYCRTYADLESKLTIMCHCVDNPQENLQTAGAILQAMKPFYP